ncbi:hypothetical protein CDL15_Pgr009653 [Punica granatum]|uniref:Uncharacterized protein n=1 Tax=Punica granatum TaxID=22663 RepID=A0A218WU04_PUNGR|nr:hypothetical protein CDL15_Pgr009653 [Punica granatum]
MASKARQNKRCSRICKNSMRLVFNVLNVSSLSLAALGLRATSRRQTPLADAVAIRDISISSASQFSRKLETDRRNGGLDSYQHDANGVGKDGEVDHRASEYIKRFHEKNRIAR